MSIKVNIIRDSSDFPSTVEVSKGSKKYVCTYDRDRGFSFNRKDLPMDVLELFKMVYPFAEKTPLESYESGELVSANTDNTAGLSTTVLYTVPAKKKLYILTATLILSPSLADATPVTGTLYDWRSQDSVSSHIIQGYHLNLGGLDMPYSNTAGPIEKAFPQAHQIRAYAGANATVSASFIGVLKDL